MKKYEYNNHFYTVKELSEMSGIPPHTIRDRLRRGYSVDEAVKDIPLHDSVVEFAEASWYEDWIGMTTSYLYKIYWEWSVSFGYTPLHHQCFTRQLLSMYPNLKIVPTKYKDGTCHRVIRERI